MSSIYENCKWCLNRNKETDTCSKLKLEARSNLDELVEDGCLSEYLEEYLGDKFSEEQLEEIEDKVYRFFQERLEVEAEFDPEDDFCCKFYR
ncbi:hypothetical protein [Fusobacterium sp.]|uniref:hypothetical protein n=1 Tax=Fusobacterium sp. TaxID=68766 RepID=UPI000E9000BF|nr:hypothetical protein [Fusobacterium sp.]HBJ77961.1 hypothetical protein [Fusobacterium sp.]